MAEEQMPQWLHRLLRTTFWKPCSKGHTKENRADDCRFCLQCYQVFCPHCTHDVPGHRLLKVRRYVYRSVVLLKNMQELGVDVSRIQPYIINGHRGVHLRPLRRSPLHRPSAGSPPCNTCGCLLRTTPNIFCSVACKEEADISRDDFSGPEAEFRYRSIQPQMLQPAQAVQQHLPAEHDHGAEAEVPALEAAEAEVPALEPAEAELPAPEPAEAPLAVNTLGLMNKLSFRRRPRKQENPKRSPLF